MYVNGILCKPLKPSLEAQLDEAVGLLTTLKSAWEEVVVAVGHHKAVVENSEHRFAGLTYSKNGLNEYIDTKSDRGFTV